MAAEREAAAAKRGARGGREEVVATEKDEMADER